ncbi:alanine racemase C-terminal domain-containing protein, partial [Escherichia coli]|nr:alanine racemase C-terminal domain-containing protein [Escherichia coli]
FRQSCNSILRCPSISDGRLSYQFSSDGYIRRSVYAYVELWGKEIKIDDVAAAAGTVGYELMCALALRVPVVTV